MLAKGEIMQTDNILLVIGNHAQQDTELTVILGFLGEFVHYADDTDWQTYVQRPETLRAIILSTQLSKRCLQDVVHAMQDWQVSVPVFSYGANNTAIACLFSATRNLVGNITYPLKQTQVMTFLHQLDNPCSIATEEITGTISQIPAKNKPLHSLVGKHSSIVQVREMIRKVSCCDASVLILGESGTGKEVVARNIHLSSPRRDKPFVPVNCGAIPAELLESELFGHEKGAFTGAISMRKGRFELAQGGTLFLDEIGDMPLAMQVKLLRVLQERSFERIGSNKSIDADVRIIAATHRNLESEIDAGKFREDLYYRLNVFPIEMPALRDRIDDLPLLIDELVSRLARDERMKIRFLPRALSALTQYEWNGNVRELANLIERMTILSPGALIDKKDLPVKFIAQEGLFAVDEVDATLEGEAVEVKESEATTYFTESGIDLKEHLINMERQLIEQALLESHGVVAKAADFLKMRRTTLVEKMRKYGMCKKQVWGGYQEIHKHSAKC